MDKTALKVFYRQNLPTIRSIKDNVVNKSYPFITYYLHNPIKIDLNTVSIVMTTHNRQAQTIHTLNTIALSHHKNVQVILVDDSTQGFFRRGIFNEYKYQINYITIDNSKKTWINPCVNYNIGFAEVKGQRLIIQNAEVCHMGDIITHVVNNIHIGEYMVFNVAALPTFDCNIWLYRNPYSYSATYSWILANKFPWYQHHVHANNKYHFMTAINVADFKLLDDGFDWDYCMGAANDDVELVFRIEHVLKLKMVPVTENNRVLGIHQYHDKNTQTNMAYNKTRNKINKALTRMKIRYFGEQKMWIYIHQNPDHIQKLVNYHIE